VVTEGERESSVFSGEGLTFVEDMGDGYKAPWDWHDLPIIRGDSLEN
jgi:hypothetical protein